MTREPDSGVSELLSKATKQNIPLNVLLELTYRCNLRCGHCYVVDPGGDELTTGEVRDVLDQLAAAGALFLTLTGGELLLREDWEELCMHARRANYAVRLFVNGTLVTPAVARRIAEIGVVDVGVSLYGATAATHERVTGAPGSFDAALGGLRALADAGVATVVKFLLMRHNVNDYQAVRALADGLGSTFTFSFNIGPRVNGERVPCHQRVAPRDLARILSDGFLYPEAPRIPRSQQADLRGSELEDAPMCGAGRDTCAITPYGEIRPCATLPIAVGDIREQPFEDSWRSSPDLVELRATHMSDLKECRQCRSVGYCGRCPAFALLEDGDVRGPSGFACEIDRISQMVEAGSTKEDGNERGVLEAESV